MISTFTRLISKSHDLMGDYTFDGTLILSSNNNRHSISGIISKNNVDIGNIALDINFNDSTISYKESDIMYNWISKDILMQFIDRLIAEANRLYSAYITALNS